jgi:NNMT/PNMT/TEMT family protein
MQNVEKLESYADLFNSREYLQQYYTSVDPENEQLLKFFVECHKDTQPHTTILEFGSGPTLYSLITAAAKVETIHVCDHLESNLQEIQAWKRGTEGAFNWQPFIQRALELEGMTRVTQADILARTALLQKKLTHFCFCDALNTSPLQGNHFKTYDIVQANFVLEAVTSSLVEWEGAFQNLLSLLKPQGTLLLSAVKNAAYYQVQGRQLPTASIDEQAFRRVLSRASFKEDHISIQTIPSNPPYRGYSDILLVKASY